MFTRSKRPALICKNTSCGGDPLSGGIPTKVRKKINFIPVECHFFFFFEQGSNPNSANSRECRDVTASRLPSNQ